MATARQDIQLGVEPKGVGGHNNRQAHVICNLQFTELYNALGAVKDGVNSGAEGAVLPQFLPITNGGTGGGTVEEARLNLNVYSKEEVDTAISNISITEAISIEQGGTGAETAGDARTNLDVYSKAEVDTAISNISITETIPIEQGGTGGTTVEEARTNLDVYSKAEVDTAISTSVPTIADATSTDKGIVRLATDTDVTNISETVAITPKGVSDMLVGVGSLAKGFRALLSARLTTMTGTNSASNTTITVTITAHGLAVGDVINITYYYQAAFMAKQTTQIVTVTSVTNANTFVFTSPAGSGSLSDKSCTLNFVIKNRHNIDSLTINAVGRYTLTINTASGIKGTGFIPFLAATTANNTPIMLQPEVITEATTLTVRTLDNTGAAVTPQWLHIGVTQ